MFRRPHRPPCGHRVTSSTQRRPRHDDDAGDATTARDETPAWVCEGRGDGGAVTVNMRPLDDRRAPLAAPSLQVPQVPFRPGQKSAVVVDEFEFFPSRFAVPPLPEFEHPCAGQGGEDG